MTTGRGFHLQGGGDIELKKKRCSRKITRFSRETPTSRATQTMGSCCKLFSVFYIERDLPATRRLAATHPPSCTQKEEHWTGDVGEDGWSESARPYSVRRGRIVRSFYSSWRPTDRGNFSLPSFFFPPFLFLFHGRDLTCEEHTQKTTTLLH